MNSINVKHYSTLLYKTTTWRDQRPLFLTPKWKKPYLKQQLQNFIQRRNAKKNHKEQCIKNKRLSDYIYSSANL